VDEATTQKMQDTLEKTAPHKPTNLTLQRPGTTKELITHMLEQFVTQMPGETFQKKQEEEVLELDDNDKGHLKDMYAMMKEMMRKIDEQEIT